MHPFGPRNADPRQRLIGGTPPPIGADLNRQAQRSPIHDLLPECFVVESAMDVIRIDPRLYTADNNFPAVFCLDEWTTANIGGPFVLSGVTFDMCSPNASQSGVPVSMADFEAPDIFGIQNQEGAFADTTFMRWGYNANTAKYGAGSATVATLPNGYNCHLAVVKNTHLELHKWSQGKRFGMAQANDPPPSTQVYANMQGFRTIRAASFPPGDWSAADKLRTKTLHFSMAASPVRFEDGDKLQVALSIPGRMFTAQIVTALGEGSPYNNYRLLCGVGRVSLELRHVSKQRPFAQ